MVDRIHQTDEEKAVLISQFVSVRSLWMVKMVSKTLSHDRRHVVILALFFCSVRSNVEGDILCVTTVG